MAIKWKNNKATTMTEEITIEKKTKKEKTWLGYLLICVLVVAVSLITYRIEPEIQKLKEKSQKEQQLAEEQGKTSTVNLEYYSDRDKMILISNIYYLNYKIENMYAGLTSSEYLLRNNKTYKNLTSEEERKRYEQEAKQLIDILYTVYRMDYGVGQADSTYTYMYDKKRGISNGQTDLADILQGKEMQEVQKKYKSYLVIDFNEKGEASITDKYNIDEGKFLNYLSNIKLQAVTDYFKSQDMYIYKYEDTENEYTVECAEDEVTDTEVTRQDDTIEQSGNERILINFPKIKNAQVIIGFRCSDSAYYGEHYETEDNLAYLTVLCIIIALFVGAFILQNVPYLNLKKQAIFCMPTEFVAFVGICVLLETFDGNLPAHMLLQTKGELQQWVTGGKILTNAALVNYIPSAIYLGIWIIYYGMIYWGIANVLPYLLHPIHNIKEKSITVKVCRWLLKQCRRCWDYVTTIQVEKGIQSNIMKVLAVNFIIVSLFCCGWFFGILGVVFYTIVLYFVLAKKASAIQKQYEGLLSMVSDMAQGELNVEVPDNLGIFEPMKKELTKVRNGFRHAVEEEVKSQNMKTELITNVSHDLKTPLTAIITYVDLLKNESLDEKTRREYIMTLEKKSQRLRVLIEDLFEVSKASSNNIVMHYADVDLVNLVKQVRLENEERIMDSDLIFRWNLPEEKCVLRLDPQRTYRIIENLLINALKYSMSGSRVYVDVIAEKEKIMFTIKNISAAELNFEAEKLTERFVRGDVSRNTEGSGLGLAIARSFTELQNGKFTVEIDGDLFKVTVDFLANPIV